MTMHGKTFSIFIHQFVFLYLDEENYNESTSINLRRINSQTTKPLSELSNGNAIERLTLDDNHSEEPTLVNKNRKKFT
jgi:hypothetical protein